MSGFRTARLFASPLAMGDMAELLAMHEDPGVMATLGGVRSEAQTQSYIAESVVHWARYGFGVYALRDETGRFVGRAGLRHLDVEGTDEVELLYSFTADCWGLGLATEIAEALVDRGLRLRKISSIIAYTTADNAASRRVMEKAGFAFECARVFKNANCVFYRLRAAHPATEISVSSV